MQRALDVLIWAWPYVAAGGTFGLALLSSAHVVLNKRDPRAAAMWVAVIWLAPLLGSALYVGVGINRIRRRARQLARPRVSLDEPDPEKGEAIGEWLLDAPHLTSLARLADRIMRRPLLGGNAVRPLIDGDEAYPAMLEAIEGARRSITLATYIFDDDEAGREVVEALARAHHRGVEVRVLIDTVGLRYSWPRSALRALRRRGVPSARFLPTWVPWRLPYMNLRLHKKTLVVDGVLGFTGGMNIRLGHALQRDPKKPVRDIHFRIEGPVVRQLQESFAEDWAFTTKEELDEAIFYRRPAPDEPLPGGVVARTITDGPDEDFEKLRWAFHGALSCAQHRVQILTPYFLPDSSLINALGGAAMRGVAVDIVLPEQGNLALPQWACRAMLWQVLELGCNVFLTPPPFDHTKLMVVDDAWTLLGSGNWDPRSYRLSFELNVECYGAELARQMRDLIDERIRSGREFTLEEADSRPLWMRLRDGTARLLTPYL